MDQSLMEMDLNLAAVLLEDKRTVPHMSLVERAITSERLDVLRFLLEDERIAQFVDWRRLMRMDRVLYRNRTRELVESVLKKYQPQLLIPLTASEILQMEQEDERERKAAEALQAWIDNRGN
eukprot:TRINITY_DN10273_c0_g1_i1.p1 TRINITY_DN10273_c0_g1~~TRINITY_DN10273_c0_g1_i1.p1  ORF type:complete len:122 (-),score=17.94 TRINITY_DN10273_c0_g1_i1:11-376(-)